MLSRTKWLEKETALPLPILQVIRYFGGRRKSQLPLRHTDMGRGTYAHGNAASSLNITLCGDSISIIFKRKDKEGEPSLS